MTFHVHWSQEAISDLGRVWLTADQQQRTAITAATNGIDRALQINPDSEGESRPEGRRVYFEPPLGILFTVNTRLQTVTVTQVWLVRKH